MGLSDIVRVNITPMSTGTGRWHRTDFATYGTVAFDTSTMRKMVGFGTALRDIPTGTFIGFGQHGRRNEEAIGPVLPVTALNLYVWLLMVPEVYREEMTGLDEALWREFGNTPISTLDSLPPIVEFIRQWIGSHVEPTNEREPRSVRFARSWYELGVFAAYRQGTLTLAQADELMRRV